MKVTIVGAGLGGLCLVQGLRAAGIEATVYERDPGITARFQGYRIGLGELGDSALRACLPRALHPVLEAVKGDLAGERTRLNHRLERTGADSSALAVAIDRHVLRHLLLSGIGEHVRFGDAFTGYEPLPGGGVRAHFAGKTSSIDSDLLVGADGIGSAVRAQLSPETPVEDSGVRALIGRTPLTERFAALVPGFGTGVSDGEVTMMLGLMRFRVLPGVLNAMAPELGLPEAGHYLRWVIMLAPDHSVLARQDLSMQEIALELTRGWHADVRAVIEDADRDNSVLLSIRTVSPAERWPAGPVTLLGDAIHATSPSGGNGANTALHDADQLRRKLIAVRDGRLPLADAVNAYETDMIDYGTEAVAHSLRELDRFRRPAAAR
ncbi:FAD-dependent oxidoreductase [Amycolatopsis sp. CA-230715]|uniref:FAD-dependent oxidoreductase n=1 Tax=Amycolatopsis sp. CA-230715 TaxID=2745196 RepID=UPI001C338F6D|nr:NAD(P)/FAD-dependent oxidoreductase [Amycolatopsis sp. CA-230715]QWF79879.1 FAD-dependent urate hydroxylase [Amycolatopsis sp. CA-230715]